MAVYDAQLQNTARNTRQYTDLDLFFGKKSSNSDIQTITDVQAVKRSIRNLVQLNVYDKPFQFLYIDTTLPDDRMMFKNFNLQK